MQNDDDKIEEIYDETRKLPVQDYELPPAPPETPVETSESEHITDKDVKTELNALKLSEPLAVLLVSLINIVLPALVCNFSPEKGNDKEDFIMDETENEAAVHAFSQYIKATNFNISPTGILITTMFSIYVPKFIYVFYTKRKQHVETMNAMKQYIDLLAEQNELLKTNAAKA